MIRHDPKNQEPLMPDNMRIPTDQEYKAYDGEHCFRLWREVGDSWKCPVCRRTRREIMRWTRRQPKPMKGITKSYMGWMAGLHRHHDHSQGEYVDLARGRFPATIICDQCNAAEGRVKQKLCLPAVFSFSPQEMAQFITAIPHGRHKIDLDKAWHVYRGIVSRWP